MPLSEQTILQTLMQWRTRLSAAAWVVVRDAHVAEDIFQNVALKAMTRDVSFEGESALLSWAFITARREGIDWLRQQQRRAELVDGEIVDLLLQDWQTKSFRQAGSRLEALEECLDTISDSARRLLKLRYFDGYNCQEVAKEMGIGLNAIYKRLSRLHHSLKACIEDKLGGAGPSGAPAS